MSFKGHSPVDERSALRALPQIQRLLELAQQDGLMIGRSRESVIAALRQEVAASRAAVLAGAPTAPTAEALLQRAQARLEPAPGMRRVINATGIVLHTNLGRAPLVPAALQAASEAAGYCDLEMDVQTGKRGRRGAATEARIAELTGAEAGLAVNNCAAAVLLALSALASGGEVVVSRGELVEIGGGFRIPDVIQQGGARLVEVGTTNKTRLADYATAITAGTRVLLKVHRSNFRLSGFTEEAGIAELAALARERGLLLVHDLGSGAALPLDRTMSLPAELTIQESVASGADLVAFSGDKLLGGPQAGLLAGRSAAIETVRRHPLLRAVRLDKLSTAALDATLRLHLKGNWQAIPALRMLAQSPATLHMRAERLAALLGPAALVQPTVGYAGGGTLPETEIPSAGIAVPTSDAELMQARLRSGTPPIIARIDQGRLLFDMLTVSDDELPELAAAIAAALAG